MVAGAGSIASAARKAWQMLDPFGKDDDEDQGGGVQKILLPTLRASLAFDFFSLAALLGSIHQPCDVPLKLWLLGGVALGFPVDHLVRSVADGKPAFEWYRLKVTSTRGNRDVSHMAIGSIVLYDQLKQPIDPGFVDQHKDGEYWRMHLVRRGKELITAYQPVTHRDESPDLDPSTWIFEGSVDGVTWQVLDEVHEAEALPYVRDAAHLIFDELFHLGKASAAFRTAFLVEALATGASLSWLLAGTVWVSAGTETCVDTAPMLWYPCYFAVVVMWSLVFSGFVMVIISGVMSVVRRRQP